MADLNTNSLPLAMTQRNTVSIGDESPVRSESATGFPSPSADSLRRELSPRRFQLQSPAFLKGEPT
ncbi:hypothetical protein [Rhodopirellula sallentina]|uniref:Uncharacterized protein n=1 Tax=Rhodopirellula sallentina SM41 TaxID=1263870 RepID=M5U3B3_9BACT|nr:hypothetical protein [Rhodopirellula sallentina]EMI55952.1 hypothetical protein RSSM_02626 [Rhodopirellula sallentina SM41]